MTKVVFEYDIATGKFGALNLIREAQSELQHLSQTLKALDTKYRGDVQYGALAGPIKSLSERANTMMTLHGWLVSLNESFIGLLHLTSETELVLDVKDKQLVSGMKLELDAAHTKWAKLMAQARRIRATSSPTKLVSGLIAGMKK